MQGPFLEVGRAGRPHGVRGEVTLVVGHRGAELLDALLDRKSGRPAGLLLDTDGKLPVLSFRRGPRGRYLLRVEGVDDRDKASALSGTPVLMKRSELSCSDLGASLSELLDFEVLDREGRLLGRVTGLLPTGGVDVLEIDGDLGHWMLPAAEALILKVDPSTHRLVVDPPEGLLPEGEPGQ